jgi:hypothetical protein
MLHKLIWPEMGNVIDIMFPCEQSRTNHTFVPELRFVINVTLCTGEENDINQVTEIFKRVAR